MNMSARPFFRAVTCLSCGVAYGDSHMSWCQFSLALSEASRTFVTFVGGAL